MYLIFDTETTGLPKSWNAPHTDTDNWPRLVQLAWEVHDNEGKLISHDNIIVKPDGFDIPFNAVKVHGITTERAMAEGIPLAEALEIFERDVVKSSLLIGHNVEFDLNIVGCEFVRAGMDTAMWDTDHLDTKDEATDFCAIPGGRGGKFKWPTLTELHQKLFGEGFDDAHDAAYDVAATARCFFGLIKEGVVKPYDDTLPANIKYEEPKLADANFAVKEKKKKTDGGADIDTEAALDQIKDVPFSHLHVHSQFSVLQATPEVDEIVNAAKELGMPAVALTDHGNMMAAFHFVRAALKAEIKPIVGCEFYLTDEMKDKSRQNNGYQTVILAKNKNGYHNLAKLASYANIDGFYYVPRIDKDILVRYKEDLIVTTGGLWGEVPHLILNVGENQAEEAFLWWKEQFGEDFYVELNRHGIEEEKHLNDVLMRFAEKHNVKYFAANNVYYTKRDDSKAHDVLLCVKDAESVNKPKKYYGKRGREYRFGFPNDEFYLKSQEEMRELFADIPEAIITANEIVEKTESYALAREVLLPAFDIPEEFQDPRDKEDPSLKIGENNYLRHLTYVGAQKRYGELTDDIRERLDFELEVIAKTGYPGYFLIVQDFTTAAREMGVSVGPGRGSAAGSAVAYCVGITNVDPIKYDLLFERFLNPERVSMPDIDIDFDDEGRGRVIDYVINKYGRNQVAQIITYGTMAAKSSIRDTARVLELPLSEADRIAKLVPDIKLGKLFGMDDKALAEKLKNNGDDIARANELKEISKGNDLAAITVNQARILEGSVRNTGIHACGVIITPDDITNFVPVALAKDSEMCCTQFDNSVVETAGLLKMDFLGLKTLTLIKDAVKNVKERHGVDVDPENIPLDDTLTYELFQRGETVGIFQYESPGMQKYMRELKPTEFADLIAMNALYRPGPLEYIPSFIRRKHGEEEITYDLEGMEEYLQETYGITVYQEQVMLLSQKLAGFTKGQADTLRKAMGKKIFALLEQLKPLFVNGGIERGHNKEKLEKVWKDWEAFASYAFNKSHSTCYAWIAYQTAYFKAHYPAEYMASVLSNNMNDIKQVTFFMEECKRAGIKVLGPDVNESKVKFSVNQEGAIRFGLGAIKGTGEAAVLAVIEEREKNGPYKDVFEFAQRVSLRAVNKKSFEVFAKAGAFDCFGGYHRRQYLYAPEGDTSLIEKAVKYGSRVQGEKNTIQQSLFGGENGAEIPLPKVADIEPFGETEKLNLEKEVVGFFISGHPLDQFSLEMRHFCKNSMSELKDLDSKVGMTMNFGGVVTEVAHKVTKNGKPFGILTVEDYDDSNAFFLFSDDYLKFKEYLVMGWYLFISGSVQQKPYGDQRAEFKIKKIDLLSELTEKRTKELHIRLKANQVDTAMVTRLDELMAKNPGKCGLKVKIVDELEKIDVDLLSRKHTLNIDNKLLAELDTIPEIEYDLKV